MVLTGGSIAVRLQAILQSRIKRHQAPVAQLDRVPGFEPGCREFESLRARQTITKGYSTKL